MLAVGESVHRVDDDGLDALAGATSEDVIHYRGDVREALAGARTGGEYVVVTGAGDADSLGLVAVEPEGDARIIRAFASAEDARAFAVDYALFDQLVDPITRLEGGVELYKGIGPEQAVVEASPDLVLDAGVLYPNEAAYVRSVISDEAVA
jgi:hypothetical protein